MVRTQIYLTEAEQQALRALSRRTGKTQSELIRQAVDHMIEQHQVLDRISVLRQARGRWSGREDLPNFDALRHEWDRATE